MKLLQFMSKGCHSDVQVVEKVLNAITLQKLI